MKILRQVAEDPKLSRRGGISSPGSLSGKVERIRSPPLSLLSLSAPPELLTSFRVADIQVCKHWNHAWVLGEGNSWESCKLAGKTEGKNGSPSAFGMLPHTTRA